MGDADAEANAARSRAWILTEGRPQPFCSLCKIDIANNPKAIKAHLKSKPHKTAMRSTQHDHNDASSELAKAQKSTKSEKKENKEKKHDSDSDSESSNSVCACVVRGVLSVLCTRPIPCFLQASVFAVLRFALRADSAHFNPKPQILNPKPTCTS